MTLWFELGTRGGGFHWSVVLFPGVGSFWNILEVGGRRCSAALALEQPFSRNPASPRGSARAGRTGRCEHGAAEPPSGASVGKRARRFHVPASSARLQGRGCCRHLPLPWAPVAPRGPRGRHAEVSPAATASSCFLTEVLPPQPPSPPPVRRVWSWPRKVLRARNTGNSYRSVNCPSLQCVTPLSDPVFHAWTCLGFVHVAVSCSRLDPPPPRALTEEQEGLGSRRPASLAARPPCHMAALASQWGPWLSWACPASLGCAPPTPTPIIRGEVRNPTCGHAAREAGLDSTVMAGWAQ